MISVRLSAQCTDARVNQVTPALFARFPTLEAFAEADVAEVEAYVRSCGFFRHKAQDIVAACRIFPNTAPRAGNTSGIGRFSGNRAGTDAATAVTLPGTGFPAGLPQRRRCFAAGDPPENGGHVPIGEARNARRGYPPASKVPNTRRICSPLSGLATYSLAPAARAFCRSRS